MNTNGHQFVSRVRVDQIVFVSIRGSSFLSRLPSRPRLNSKIGIADLTKVMPSANQPDTDIDSSDISEVNDFSELER